MVHGLMWRIQAGPDERPRYDGSETVPMWSLREFYAPIFTTCDMNSVQIALNSSVVPLKFTRMLDAHEKMRSVMTELSAVTELLARRQRRTLIEAAAAHRV